MKFLAVLLFVAAPAMAHSEKVVAPNAWLLKPGQKLVGYSVPNRVFIHTAEVKLNAFKPGYNKIEFTGSYIDTEYGPYRLVGDYPLYSHEMANGRYALTAQIQEWSNCQSEQCYCGVEPNLSFNLYVTLEATAEGDVDPKSLRVEGDAGVRPGNDPHSPHETRTTVVYEIDHERL